MARAAKGAMAALNAISKSDQSANRAQSRQERQVNPTRANHIMVNHQNPRIAYAADMHNRMQPPHIAIFPVTH